MLKQYIHKIGFRIRFFADVSLARRVWWSALGANIGLKTNIPRLQMTWPHQVKIGSSCILENGIDFKFDGIWQPGPSIIIGDRVFLGKDCEFNIRRSVQIGDDCLIASGCKFVDHDHGLETDCPMNRQPGPEISILLHEDVWLGCNVVVLKGVTIGRGAVVGAGAIVTKPVPPFEIWAGIPARKIGERGQVQPVVPEKALLRDSLTP